MQSAFLNAHGCVGKGGQPDTLGFSYKRGNGGGEMAEWHKCLPHKPRDMRLIPGSQTVGRENSQLQVVL